MEQVVLITGAAGNLGRAVAAHFSKQGARLALVDRPGALAGHGGNESDVSRLHVSADLLDAGDARRAVWAAWDRFGRIDVVCNLVGGFRMGEPVHQARRETWDFLFDINVHSLVHVAQAVIPRMLEAGHGCVINVSAAAAGRGAALMGPYIAAKSVVARLTESMSAEVRDRGIRVNCVMPSIIDTPENRAAMPDADPARWVSPESLAHVVAFLASPDASAIHGACIPVTGLV